VSKFGFSASVAKRHIPLSHPAMAEPWQSALEVLEEYTQVVGAKGENWVAE